MNKLISIGTIFKIITNFMKLELLLRNEKIATEENKK
jgi:hypothetical protein